MGSALTERILVTESTNKIVKNLFFIFFDFRIVNNVFFVAAKVGIPSEN